MVTQEGRRKASLSFFLHGTKHIGKAFTLVELVAVIAIISVLALVAGPRFSGRDAFDARGTYGTILSALRYAQKTAVAQRTTVYFSVDIVKRNICLGYTNNCSSSVMDPSTHTAYSKVLPSSLTLTASQTPLGFDGLGRPTPNMTATYTIQNMVDPSDPIRAINVEAETGYVH